jgi:hypothetical protein
MGLFESCSTCSSSGEWRTSNGHCQQPRSLVPLKWITLRIDCTSLPARAQCTSARPRPTADKKHTAHTEHTYQSTAESGGAKLVVDAASWLMQPGGW